MAPTDRLAAAGDRCAFALPGGVVVLLKGCLAVVGVVALIVVGIVSISPYAA